MGAGLIVYLSLADILAAFQVYRLDREIVKLRQEIDDLTIKNQDLKNLIAYLKTDSFKEKEARRKLNYRKPGEQVLVIPEPIALIGNGEGKGAAPSPEEELKNLSTPYKWWYYFFDK